MNIVIATTKSWNINNAEAFRRAHQEVNVTVIDNESDLTFDLLSEISPQYVFFPHWSWIIPKDIYENYNCIVFHMTDLPFGRGGSPLQNLIERGVYDTKISAIKVSAGLDTGPIYCKEPIDLSEGNADEILSRISEIVFKKMIPRFLNEELIPVEQAGTVVSFKRRTPEQSEIPDGLLQRQIYDYIRMLDGEGYPPAYIRYKGGRFIFTNAKYENGVTTASVRFVEDVD